jgi:hypothetical protein
MAKRPVFTFLTDVNVPDSVGDFLTSQGHDVVRVRDVMAIDATDPVVAQAAMEAKRILVSWDKDFNHQRFLAPRYARLSRVGFSCPEPEGASRLKDVLDLFEFAIKRAKGKPVTIRIGRDKLQIKC